MRIKNESCSSSRGLSRDIQSYAVALPFDSGLPSKSIPGYYVLAKSPGLGYGAKLQLAFKGCQSPTPPLNVQICEASSSEISGGGSVQMIRMDFLHFIVTLNNCYRDAPSAGMSERSSDRSGLAKET